MRVVVRQGFYCSMKIARVIPLFKSGNTKEFSNYRPTVFDLISGLSAYVILGPKNRPN